MSLSTQQESYSDCCLYLLRHASVRKGPNDSKFKNDLACIQLQESVISSVIDEVTRTHYSSNTIEPPLDTVAQLEALFVFVWYQHWTKPNTKIAARLVQLSHRLSDSAHYEAEAFFCLGKMLFRMDAYDDAKECFRASKELVMALDWPIQTLRLEMEYTQCLMWSGIPPEEEILESIDNLIMEIDTSEARNLHLFHMARLRWGDIGWSGEVIGHLSAAIEGFESLGMPLEAADCRYCLARTYASADNYTEGLRVAEEAVQAYDQLGISGRGYGVFIHIVKARYLKATNIWDTRLTITLEAALILIKDYGVPLARAQILEEWAEVYVRMEDWINGKLAYAAALEACSKVTGETGMCVLTNCLNNLEFIRRKETEQPVSDSDFVQPDRY